MFFTRLTETSAYFVPAEPGGCPILVAGSITFGSYGAKNIIGVSCAAKLYSSSHFEFCRHLAQGSESGELAPEIWILTAPFEENGIQIASSVNLFT